ncbi:MAG: PilW family protein [Tepidimonas sp.]|uniref:PilW family protein n=1 Tax=Tepidimonas sp. TaxID=2002775 RepID=UPI00259D50AB|nr:PilW family protein [Tepidimonas sp.]MDM7457030.1 PilW family protein [Tepidimonas sp.]
MIALALGLIITGAVFALLLSSRQNLRATENLARLHDDARISFELLAREIREAGATLCGTPNISNVLNNANTVWWSNTGNWNDEAIRGYSGTAVGPIEFGSGGAKRVNGTDAIALKRASDRAVTIISHNPVSAQFKVNSTQHGIQDGDILMACDEQSGAVFQVTNASSTNATIIHNTGTGTPGNCSKDLGYPTQCSGNRKERTFAPGGLLATYQASFWYIGNSPMAGRRSLYRADNTRGPIEMARNVSDLQAEYLLSNRAIPPTLADSYVRADQVSRWADVVAVRVTLTHQTDENISTENQTITRTSSYLISLRNREFLP